VGGHVGPQFDVWIDGLLGLHGAHLHLMSVETQRFQVCVLALTVWLAHRFLN